MTGDGAGRVADRMAQVLGSPPRMEPRADEALGEREKGVISRLRAVGMAPPQAPEEPEQPVHPFFATLCHQPEFFAAYMEMGIGTATRASLEPLHRELIILRTGWLCGAPYQFGEHVRISRELGFTAEDIERIKQGSTAPAWSEPHRAILKAVEELHSDAMISDATWAVLAVHLCDSQLIELPMIAGHYHTTAFIQNSLRFRLNDYNEGLAAG